METIVCNWVGILVDNKSGSDVFVYTMAEKVVLLYYAYRLIVPTNPLWLQWGSNT